MNHIQHSASCDTSIRYNSGGLPRQIDQSHVLGLKYVFSNMLILNQKRHDNLRTVGKGQNTIPACRWNSCLFCTLNFSLLNIKTSQVVYIWIYFRSIQISLLWISRFSNELARNDWRMAEYFSGVALPINLGGHNKPIKCEGQIIIVAFPRCGQPIKKQQSYIEWGSKNILIYRLGIIKQCWIYCLERGAMQTDVISM